MTIVPELVAVLVTTRFAVAEAEPPSMLISPVLESPPAPFTVKVSADVMPVLPMEMPLPLVLLLVSVPPIVRLVPPAPPMLGPSSSTVPLPVTLTLPVGLTVAPFSSQKFPATVVRPVSALLVVRRCRRRRRANSRRRATACHRPS